MTQSSGKTSAKGTSPAREDPRWFLIHDWMPSCSSSALNDSTSTKFCETSNFRIVEAVEAVRKKREVFSVSPVGRVFGRIEAECQAYNMSARPVSESNKAAILMNNVNRKIVWMESACFVSVAIRASC